MAEVRRLACGRRSASLPLRVSQRACDETENSTAAPLAAVSGPTRPGPIYRGTPHFVLRNIERSVPLGLPLGACLSNIRGGARRGRRDVEGGRISPPGGVPSPSPGARPFVP